MLYTTIFALYTRPVHKYYPNIFKKVAKFIEKIWFFSHMKRKQCIITSNITRWKVKEHRLQNDTIRTWVESRNRWNRKMHSLRQKTLKNEKFVNNRPLFSMLLFYKYIVSPEVQLVYLVDVTFHILVCFGYKNFI